MGRQSYRMFRAGDPHWRQVRDIEIFRLIVASRYTRLPHPKAQAFLEGWLSNENQGLESVVVGVLMAENDWDVLDFPPVFREVVHEELLKSGLPHSVLYGQPFGRKPEAAKPIARTIEVIIAMGDDDIAEVFADAVQSALPEDVTLCTLIPQSVHDADLLALIAEHDWELAMVLINNVRYSSYSDSRDHWQEDSLKMIKRLITDCNRPIICCYPSASSITPDYLRQLTNAGVCGMIQVPCSTEVIRATVRQCLSIS